MLLYLVVCTLCAFLDRFQTSLAVVNSIRAEGGLPPCAGIEAATLNVLIGFCFRTEGALNCFSVYNSRKTNVSIALSSVSVAPRVLAPTRKNMKDFTLPLVPSEGAAAPSVDGLHRVMRVDSIMRNYSSMPSGLAIFFVIVVACCNSGSRRSAEFVQAR